MRLPALETTAGEPKRKRRLSVAGRPVPDYRQDLDWLFGHEGTVMDIDFTPDGKFLVSCSSDGTVKVWDVATKTRRPRLHRTRQERVRCAREPRRQIGCIGLGRVGGQQSAATIVIWRRETGEHTSILSAVTSAAITQLRFTSDGKRLVSVSGHQTQQKGEINHLGRGDGQDRSTKSRGLASDQRAGHIAG